MIELNQVTENELTSVATLTGLTVDQLLTRMLQDVRADIQDVIDVEASIKEFKESGDKTITLEQLQKENDL